MSPPIAQVGGASAQRPDAARQAFFQAALGKAAPAAQAVAADPAPAPARPQKVPDAGAEPPTRILRPGSLLDIRV